jgi:hypothetical protein
VRRNRDRFPVDFVFHLEIKELQSRRLQFATASRRFRNLRFPPLAFKEHGAIMAATILNSPRAVEMSVYVVRAFVKLREVLASGLQGDPSADDPDRAEVAADWLYRRSRWGPVTQIGQR